MISLYWYTHKFELIEAFKSNQITLFQASWPIANRQTDTHKQLDSNHPFKQTKWFMAIRIGGRNRTGNECGRKQATGTKATELRVVAINYLSTELGSTLLVARYATRLYGTKSVGRRITFKKVLQKIAKCTCDITCIWKYQRKSWCVN